MKNYYKLIALASTLLVSGSVFAEEAATAVGMGHGHGAAGMAAGWIALGAGLAIGAAALGGALGQGKAAAAALDGIARNPAASGKLFLPLILSLALMESLVIYALVISFQLNGQIGKLVEVLAK